MSIQDNQRFLQRQNIMEPEFKQQADHPIKLQELPKRIKGAQRPKTTVKVLTNYFPIKLQSFACINIFKITFSPPIQHDNRRLRLELLKEALPLLKEQIVNPVIAGMNIYSTSQPISNEAEYSIKDYKLRVALVKSIDALQNSKAFLHFLNNAIKNIMNLENYIEIGTTRKYFNISKGKQIASNLILYPGFKANFMLAESGLFLRINPTYKIVQRQTVLEFIDCIYRNSKFSCKEQRRQQVKQALIGKIIMTNYGKSRYLRIQDIEFRLMKQVEIEFKRGKISQKLYLIDYYKKMYNIAIKSTNQPLLIVEDKISRNNPNQNFKVYIIPELCLMTGFPEDMDEMSRRKFSEIIMEKPEQQYNKIMSFMKEIKNNEKDQSLGEIGIQISDQCQKIQAQILQTPELKLSDKNRVDRGKQTFFNLFDQKMYDSSKKMNIGFVYFEYMNITGMLDTFMKTAPKLGLEFKYKNYKIQDNICDPKNKIIRCIENAMEKEECNCFVIVLKKFMANLYQDIKKTCLEKLRIITQVVLESTLAKTNSRSIHTKILIQIASKLGNIPWQPVSPEIVANNSMIMSFNFSKAGKVKKLVGVGSSDKYFSSYFSESVDVVDSLNKFKEMVGIAIKLVARYVKKNNQKLPKELIIFTDSCPKNQIKILHDNFISLFLVKMSEISQSAKEMKLTIIHVKDKCSESFFKPREYGGFDNPSPGMVVCNKIVSENYDFFLISQRVTRGCAVPIHFNVVYSESKLEESILHELVYSQCFNYFNWMGSIKIPAVMQYAKKFGRFCSQVLKNNIDDDSLVQRLYYI